MKRGWILAASAVVVACSTRADNAPGAIEETPPAAVAPADTVRMDSAGAGFVQPDAGERSDTVSSGDSEAAPR